MIKEEMNKCSSIMKSQFFLINYNEYGLIFNSFFFNVLYLQFITLPKYGSNIFINVVNNIYIDFFGNFPVHFHPQN